MGGRAQVGRGPHVTLYHYAGAVRSMAAGFVEGRRDLSVCVHGEVRGLVENRPVARTHRKRERAVLVSFVQVEVVPKREPSRQGRLSRVKRYRGERPRRGEGRPELPTGQRVDVSHTVVRDR